VWTAKPGESIRVPAIRELTGVSLWQKYFLNPTGGILNSLGGQAQGMADKLTPLLEALYKSQAVIMRVHSDIYMPLIAGMPGSTADPNAPMMQMNQEAAELSDAPVAASYCEIPKDFAVTPVDEMMKAMIKSAMPQAPPASAPPAAH
jgi:hypothetical protein